MYNIFRDTLITPYSTRPYLPVLTYLMTQRGRLHVPEEPYYFILDQMHCSIYLRQQLR